jgi:hypothetical protein
MTEQKKYIIHDNTLFEEKQGPLVTTYTPFTIDQRPPIPQWNGPKIPWAMWQEMVAWCQVTQKKFGSEALVLLFFNQDTNQWFNWYCPQVTNGMTVKADEEDPEYKLQRKDFPDLQFGTLHHHCTADAFASGTDKSDEEDREGLHFTIGNIGSKEHSLHYRICIQGKCYKGNIVDVIEPPIEVTQLPEKYQRGLMELMLKDPVDSHLWDFTEPLKNVKKTSYQTHQGGIGQGAKDRPILRNITLTASDIEELIYKDLDTTETLLEEIDTLLWYHDIKDNWKTTEDPAETAFKYLSKKYKSKAKTTAQNDFKTELSKLILETYGIGNIAINKINVCKLVDLILPILSKYCITLVAR